MDTTTKRIDAVAELMQKRGLARVRIEEGDSAIELERPEAFPAPVMVGAAPAGVTSAAAPAEVAPASEAAPLPAADASEPEGEEPLDMSKVTAVKADRCRYLDRHEEDLETGGKDRLRACGVCRDIPAGTLKRISCTHGRTHAEDGPQDIGQIGVRLECIGEVRERCKADHAGTLAFCCCALRRLADGILRRHVVEEVPCLIGKDPGAQAGRSERRLHVVALLGIREIASPGNKCTGAEEGLELQRIGCCLVDANRSPDGRHKRRIET